MRILWVAEYAHIDVSGAVCVGMGILWVVGYTHTNVSGMVCGGMRIVQAVLYSHTAANGRWRDGSKDVRRNGGKKWPSERRWHVPFVIFA